VGESDDKETRNTRQWDAVSYDRVSGPLEALGVAVVDRLELTGDEVVLDAGCGSGRITAHLADRLPAGRVIAVDSSAAMVAEARRRLGDRVDVRHGDLLELELEEPVDAIVSTATFHWVLDHGRLFERLHRALRPGGRLAAQCGGQGNIAGVLGAASAVAAGPPFARHLAGFRRPSRFAGAEETAALLREAGFKDVRCGLTPRPVVPEEPARYLETITLGPHLEALPSSLRRRFVDEVLATLPQPAMIDYVRLDIDATRPPA
jgi:trans-aconitate 2-methyltransferase